MWKKGALSHQKMKCSFLDYIQLLIIGWAIWVQWKLTQNAKKGPQCHQKMKFSCFGLHSTSNVSVWVNLSDESLGLKCKERPPKSSKNGNTYFWISMQLLMIGWVIQSTKVSTQDNAKKVFSKSPPKSEMLVCDGHYVPTSDDQPSTSDNL